MTPTARRFLGYPIVGLAGALLLYCALYETEADFGTLLSSANLHAGLASAIPANTGDEDGLELRQQLISDAEQWLGRAEAVEPGTSPACEVRAFIASLRGDHLGAARLYSEARSLPDFQDGRLPELVLNEAMALSNGDRPAQALEVLRRHEERLARDRAGATACLRVRILARLGRDEEARSAARALAQAGDDEDLLMAGALLEELHEWDAAEAAYRRAAGDPAVTNYCLARLKIRVGQIDSALELLERAVESSRPTVLRSLERDRELWEVCAETDRFRSLTAQEDEAAHPGR